MRTLFFIALIVVATLGILNGYYLPMTQERGRLVMDQYVQSFPVYDINERTYKGNISLRPLSTEIVDLHIASGRARWMRTEYSDVMLDIDKITFKADSLLRKGKQEVTGVGEIKFQGRINYDELGKLIAELNSDLKQSSLMYEGGHFYLDGYFEPLKGALLFDGAFILTPSGELKYQIKNVANEDREVLRSREVLSLIEEKLTLIIPIRVIDRTITLDKIEITDDYIQVTGKSLPVPQNNY